MSLRRMDFTAAKSRFESDIHLGFLAIVFVLVLVNVAANLTIYKSRMTQRQLVQTDMHEASLTASRMVHESMGSLLHEEQAAGLKRAYGLTRLVHAPFRGDDTFRSAANWRELLMSNRFDRQVRALADDLTSDGFRRLVRGPGDEYYYVYPLPVNSGQGLLVLSRRETPLARLDDWGRWLLIVSILGVAAVFAGEYRLIISELEAKETELRRLNQQIQSKADSLEDFNQYLMESTDSGIITVDSLGRVVSLNGGAEKILSAEAKACLGTHFWELMSENVTLVNAVSRALECGKNQPYAEVDLESANGRRLRLGIQVSTITDHTGSRVGASVLINDLTELTALRDELETKRRLAALGEMAGGLAHQLRNSIGAIAGYGNLVKRALGREGLDTVRAQALLDESREAEALVKRFLCFTRPFDYNPVPDSLTDILREVVNAFEVRNDLVNVSIVFDTREDVGVNCDRLLIKQAAANLVENAAQAYDGGPGSVLVRITSREDNVTVEVEDFGRGIEPQHLDRIFTPFFSSRPSGTGLGLPLAMRIVDLHGGSLTVDSTLGRGTKFSLRLPRTGACEPAAPGCA